MAEDVRWEGGETVVVEDEDAEGDQVGNALGEVFEAVVCQGEIGEVGQTLEGKDQRGEAVVVQVEGGERGEAGQLEGGHHG